MDHMIWYINVIYNKFGCLGRRMILRRFSENLRRFLISGSNWFCTYMQILRKRPYQSVCDLNHRHLCLNIPQCIASILFFHHHRMLLSNLTTPPIRQILVLYILLLYSTYSRMLVVVECRQSASNADCSLLFATVQLLILPRNGMLSLWMQHFLQTAFVYLQPFLRF